MVGIRESARCAGCKRGYPWASFDGEGNPWQDPFAGFHAVLMSATECKNFFIIGLNKKKKIEVKAEQQRTEHQEVHGEVRCSSGAPKFIRMELALAPK